MNSILPYLPDIYQIFTSNFRYTDIDVYHFTNIYGYIDKRENAFVFMREILFVYIFGGKNGKMVKISECITKMCVKNLGKLCGKIHGGA